MNAKQADELIKVITRAVLNLEKRVRNLEDWNLVITHYLKSTAKPRAKRRAI